MEQHDAEALRQRLYRPGASPADVRSYLRVAGPEQRDAATEAAPPHLAGTVDADPRQPSIRKRRRLPFAVAGVLVVLASVAIAVGARTAPGAAPAPTPSAGWTPAPRDPGDSLARVLVVDSGRRPGATGRALPSVHQGYRYTVARGDTVTGIADRFALCVGDVLQVLPYGFDPGRLPTGATLDLMRSDSTPC